MAAAVKRVLGRWKAFAERLAAFQARLLVTAIYFILATPVSLVVKIFGDPLRLRRPKASSQTSMWTPREAQLTTIEEAKKQF